MLGGSKDSNDKAALQDITKREKNKSLDKNLGFWLINSGIVLVKRALKHEVRLGNKVEIRVAKI